MFRAPCYCFGFRIYPTNPRVLFRPSISSFVRPSTPFASYAANLLSIDCTRLREPRTQYSNRINRLKLNRYRRRRKQEGSWAFPTCSPLYRLCTDTRVQTLRDWDWLRPSHSLSINPIPSTTPTASSTAPLQIAVIDKLVSVHTHQPQTYPTLPHPLPTFPNLCHFLYSLTANLGVIDRGSLCLTYETGHHLIIFSLIDGCDLPTLLSVDHISSVLPGILRYSLYSVCTPLLCS